MLKTIRILKAIRESYRVLKLATEEKNTDNLSLLCLEWVNMINLSFVVCNNKLLRAIVGSYLSQVNVFSKYIYHKSKSIYTKIYSHIYIITCSIVHNQQVEPTTFLKQHSVYSDIERLHNLMSSVIQILYDHTVIENGISQDYNIPQNTFTAKEEVNLCNIHKSINDIVVSVNENELTVEDLSKFLDTFKNRVISCQSEAECGIKLYNVPQVIPLI